MTLPSHQGFCPEIQNGHPVQKGRGKKNWVRAAQPGKVALISRALVNSIWLCPSFHSGHLLHFVPLISLIHLSISLVDSFPTTLLSD
jgi:hypothetical protein